jgi:hypothetical protein
MNFEILIRNLFMLLIFAAILEACVTAIFSLSAIKEMSENRPTQITRDTLIVALAVVLCYKIDVLSLFSGTGVHLHKYLDTAISALVMISLANFLSGFFGKMRR